MKQKCCAIMQPYFFPYIGYFDLIFQADVFVFFDDVNFKNRSFISRNYFGPDRARYSVILDGASQNKKIRDIHVKDPEWLSSDFYRFLASIFSAETHFSNFEEVWKHCRFFEGMSISDLNIATITQMVELFGYQGELLLSSDIGFYELKGQERVLKICQELGASKYVNLPGGKSIYSYADFNKRGIELFFTEPQHDARFSCDKAILYSSVIDWLVKYDVNDLRGLIGAMRGG